MLIRSLVTAAVLVAAPVAPASVTPIVAQQTRPAAHTDDALKDKIAFRLETNASIRKYDLRVKVDNGVATLSGDVATAAQKAEAERLAKVDGVTKVVNTIQIDPNEDKTVADRIKSGMSKTGEKITDAWITTKVKWFFVGEDALKGSDINVDTTNGVVTLKGTVASAAGKARAEALAKDTDGVTRVVDQLVVKK